MNPEMIPEAERRMKEGGESSITPPGTRKELGQETGGEDMMVLNLAVKWRDWPGLRGALEGARQCAMDTGHLVVVRVRDEEWLVHPSGSGFGQSYAKYKVEAGGLVFAIQDKAEGLPEAPNVRVLAGSLVCMHFKSVGLLKHVETTLGNLGGTVERCQVSRVDMCVDLGGVDVAVFVEGQFSNRYVSRARHRAAYWDGVKASGVQIGKGKLLVRIYEKALETGREGSKWQYLCRHRYGGNPEQAVRVEIQLGREMLKELGVDSIEEYEEKKAAIAEYILTDWLRLCGEDVDRDNRHQDTAAEHPIWKTVRAAFRKWTGTPANVVKRVKRCSVVMEALLKQAIGCLCAAGFEDTGQVPGNWRQFLGDMFCSMHRFLEREGAEYWERLEGRNLEKYIKRTVAYQGDKEPPFRWFDVEHQFDFDWSRGKFGVVAA